MNIRELKKLAQIIIFKHNLTPIKIEFKAVRRGRGRTLTRKITMPIWIFKGIREYQYYYIIHELAHFILIDKFGLNGHGKVFKKLESQILKDYNIIPIYSRSYPKQLKDLQGNIICNKYGIKNG